MRYNKNNRKILCEYNKKLHSVKIMGMQLHNSKVFFEKQEDAFLSCSWTAVWHIP